MFDGNIYALVSVLLGTVAVGVLIFYLIPLQLQEVLKPKDWLTKLRWQILSILSLITLMAFPSLVYQLFRFMGADYENLRNVATVTNRLSFLGIVFVLILVFNYKRKD